MENSMQGGKETQTILDHGSVYLCKTPFLRESLFILILQTQLEWKKKLAQSKPMSFMIKRGP